ncbi:hypothetical protein [Phaeovulum sp. NW3]|uniref:hypothetical protein n=1 Tax=Phaeovulum sp. NW3 TaxID=2934933 RepID=UPI0020220101|nr:hypothetical protein [Phaeovulum sp. NW3]MCL7466051.1 hypothetical protein [Phaeovulum sp. NW3]
MKKMPPSGGIILGRSVVNNCDKNGQCRDFQAARERNANKNQYLNSLRMDDWSFYMTSNNWAFQMSQGRPASH